MIIKQREVSTIDVDHLEKIRAGVISFMKRCAAEWATQPGRLLDIAPQDHEGARPFFGDEITVETFDIDPDAAATYTGDICRRNDFLLDDSYDYIVCTEVLEHTLQPFDAVLEIRRILRPGGLVFITTPFNFRIHGPLPDCWRFTEHGLRALFDDFEIELLDEVETEGRWLMPIQYGLVARKPAA